MRLIWDNYKEHGYMVEEIESIDGSLGENPDNGQKDYFIGICQHGEFNYIGNYIIDDKFTIDDAIANYNEFALKLGIEGYARISELKNFNMW